MNDHRVRYCDGRELQNLQSKLGYLDRRAPLSEAEARHFMRHFAAGLAVLHA
jgi:serine/threonine protein kinase